MVSISTSSPSVPQVCSAVRTFIPVRIPRAKQHRSPRDNPADRVTEFYVESASLVSFFVKWKGEREFTTFLREAERYGFSGALTKHYGIKDVQQLETTWKKAALATARGQGE